MARRHIMESTFRLNLLNPQHAKINEVIKRLNPKIYKSKNQFLIEACEFYIDHYGEDDIPSKEEKRYEQFVTRDEIEKIKKEIEYSAMSEARKEVISLLGGALAGVKNSQPVVIANPQEDMEEQPMPVEKQVIIIYAATRKYLLDIPVEQVLPFEKALFEYVDTKYPDVPEAIRTEKVISDETEAKLVKAIEECKADFLK